MGNSVQTISYGASTPEIRERIKEALNWFVYKNNNRISPTTYFENITSGVHNAFVSPYISINGRDVYIIDLTHTELRSFIINSISTFIERFNNRNDVSSVLSYKVKILPWTLLYNETIRIDIYVNSRPNNKLLPRVAKIVAKDLLTTSAFDETVCPITFELLTEVDTVYVGICGHVFSQAVSSLSTCPVCTIRTVWTDIRTTQII